MNMCFHFRRAVLIGLGWLLLSGSTARPLAAAPANQLQLPVARVHWLGMKQISADINSARAMKVWHLPETAAMVSQTLDKISRLPGHGTTNAASALLRPLLDDLLTSESYLEVYAAPTQHPATSNLQLLLALRLPPDRARLWQANLPAALPEAVVSPDGEWTLIGLGAGTAAMLPSLSSAIRHTSPSTLWLEADLSPAGLVAMSPTDLSALHLPFSTFSHLHLTATGEADKVRTVAALDFSRPLTTTLPRWEVPKELVHQPLTSFTAVRGLAAWLATVPAWQDLQIAPAPDQVFCWALPGSPFQTYFAAPLPSASNQLTQLAGRLVPNGNSWLATNEAMGKFLWSAKSATLVWKNAFILSPFLAPATDHQRDYVLGGLIPRMEANLNSNPSAAEFFNQVLSPPNLVYFQGEQTGRRIADGFYNLQALRLIFHKPQLALNSGTAGAWLKKIAPLLDSSTTLVTRSGPQQLYFSRESTIGFTALELQILVDWLESPQFPSGLHTLSVQ